MATLSDLVRSALRLRPDRKRSYLIEYRAQGRSQRFTIGPHGVWTPELARREAKSQLGRVARGDNPAEERQLDHQAITMKELCLNYLADLNAGLILGKYRRPKKQSTIGTDTGRIKRHIIPLLGQRRVKDVTRADVSKAMKDIMADKTAIIIKTEKLRGKAIVRGGAGTATRTMGLFGGIMTYACEAGIIDANPAHGIRKPKDNVRERRLSEAEYRKLGAILSEVRADGQYEIATEIIQLLALTGCRRSERSFCAGASSTTSAVAFGWKIAKRVNRSDLSGYKWLRLCNTAENGRMAAMCLPDTAPMMPLVRLQTIGTKLSDILPWPTSRRTSCGIALRAWQTTLASPK